MNTIANKYLHITTMSGDIFCIKKVKEHTTITKWADASWWLMCFF